MEQSGKQNKQNKTKQGTYVLKVSIQRVHPGGDGKLGRGISLVPATLLVIIHSRVNQAFQVIHRWRIFFHGILARPVRVAREENDAAAGIAKAAQ